MWPIQGLVDDYFPGLLSGFHGYTIAAVTPKADESIGAAKTRTETTRPIMQALRPNSVSSPPQSIDPPAMAIPIKPIAYAIGPVSDVAMAVIGASQGNPPAAEAWARTLAVNARVNRVVMRDNKRDEVNKRVFIYGFSPK